MADINISVALDSAKAEQSAKNLDDKIKDMSGSADKAQSPFSGLWKQIFAGVAVTTLVNKGVQEFTQFLGDSIKAAIAADKANADLKSALGATGREVAGNARHFIDYASRLQKLTTYDDEAIKGAQALLIQLTTLDRDGIDRATKGAIGLAYVLSSGGTQMSVETAAMLVAKAMEGNTAALSRYGIKVTETGTAEEKRNELLQKLEGYYKRATDATGTFAGKQAQLRNNLEELKETIGKSIIENETLQKTVADLSLGFQYLAEHGEKLKKVIDVVFAVAKGGGLAIFMELLALLADKQRKLNAQVEAGQKLAVEYNKTFLDIAKSGKDLSASPILKFFVDMARGTKEGAAALKLTDEWAKKFGITLKTTLIEQLNDAREALERLKKSGEATPGAIEALNKKIKELEVYLKGTEKAQDKFSGSAKASAEIILYQLVPAARKLNEEFGKTPLVVDLVFKKALPKWLTALREFFKEHEKEIMMSVALAQQGIGLMETAWNNYYIGQMNNVESDYQKRREAIEKSTLDEAEKQAALEALDKEYEEKKKKLQREAAGRQKSAAIVQAIINTAEAVTKALTGAIPPFNYILAAISAAMGAAQIALIKAQPIPLARGAIFDRPTLLASGRYEVGEAGKEAALPVEPFMKEIRSIVAKGKGDNIQITIPIYLDGQKLDERIIKVMKRQGDLGRLKLSSKVVN